MRKDSTTKVYIFIGLFIAAVISIISRNHYVTLKEKVDFQQSQVETMLQRRYDLIPNLVETVKAYAKHEDEVFTEIANARSQLMSGIQSSDISKIDEASSALTSAVDKLLIISENYPELKANEQFTGLRDELAGTENRIAVARQYYNETAMVYNNAIKRFPGSIFAFMFGYEPAEYFKATESATEVPVVDFN